MKGEPHDAAGLIAALEGTDKSTIRRAVDSLIPMAAQTPQVRKRLGDILTNPAHKNRWAVAYILAHLVDPPKMGLEVLLDALETNDPDVRWAIALLLIRLGKGDVQIVERLLDLLGKGTPNQKRMAIYCLRDIGVEQHTSFRELLAPLEDRDPLVRVAAVTALGTLRNVGREGADKLLKLLLADPDERVKCSAALTLARIENPSEEIQAALAEASRGKQANIRKAAQTALKLLENKKGLASAAKPAAKDEPSVD